MTDDTTTQAPDDDAETAPAEEMTQVDETAEAPPAEMTQVDDDAPQSTEDSTP